MAEIEWESLASCLLNLLDKCELGFDEATYPIAANAFNGVELALSVIRHIADSANEQQSVSRTLRMFWRDSSAFVAASCRYWKKDNKFSRFGNTIHFEQWAWEALLQCTSNCS